MKLFKNTLGLFALLAFVGCSVDDDPNANLQSLADSGRLTIRVENIKNHDGFICYNMVSEASQSVFPDAASQDPHARAGCVVIESLPMQDIVLEDVANGVYAISLFHDRNGNKILDTGLFGAPKEPLGLSTVRKIPLRKPTFAETKFIHQGDSMQTIKLHKIL